TTYAALDTNIQKKADLVFASDISSTSGVSLASPAAWWVSGFYNGNRTRLSAMHFEEQDMDHYYYSRSLAQFFDSTTTTGTDVRDFTTSFSQNHAMVYCQTHSGNYARVEILPQSNGTLVGGFYG